MLSWGAFVTPQKVLKLRKCLLVMTKRILFLHSQANSPQGPLVIE